MAETTAKELARDSIRVSGVLPGIIDSPLAYDLAMGGARPLGGFAISRQAGAEKIGRYVLFVAADATFSAGQRVHGRRRLLDAPL